MTNKKAYVVGNNTHKSLSPIIFNYWFKKYKINGEYRYIEIKEENFNNEIKKLLGEKSLCGLNITIPFKEKIIHHLDTIDKHSTLIGAVNCVSKVEEKLEGMNTDWIGFQESIKWQEKHGLPKIERKDTAIVIGYGGSAKAVIYSLSKMGFKKIRVFNRSYEKISKLTNIIPHKLEDLEHHFKEGDLIVNTIPTNYYEELKLNLPRHTIVDRSSATGHGFDAVYNYNTFFLGHIAYVKRIYGHHMLIHQAIPCFYKWFGVKPEVDMGLVALLEKKTLKE